MDTETSTSEVRQLRRCIRDLVALSALPAAWIGYDPRRIAESLADVLRHMLHLDLIYINVRGYADGIAAEVAHSAGGPVPVDRARELGRALAPWLGSDCWEMPPAIPNLVGNGTIRVASITFGIGAGRGVLIAGSQRADFPTEADRMLLEVGANQAAILLERRQAEERLQESQRQLTDFVENATEGLHWAGPDGTILWANQAEMDLLGYARDEYIGHRLAEFHADPLVFEDFIRRLAGGERLVGYEARLRCKDGTMKDVLINSDVLWEGGKFIHTRCFTRDITERKRAEGALRESEETFRFLTDSIPHIVWEARPDGYNVYHNARCLEYLGVTQEQLQGWDWAEMIHPDDRQRTLEEWEHAFRTEVEYRIEHRIRNGRTGEYRWFIGHAVPQREAGGRVVRWFGTSTDIDERKRAEEALRESERRLQLALEAGRMGTWDWNILTDAVTWSRSLEAIHGLAPGAFGGTLEDSLRLVHPEDLEPMKQAIARIVVHGMGGTLEYRIVRPDGRILWLEGRGNPGHPDGTGRSTLILGVCADITERKKAEEALRQSEERFRSLSACSPVGIFQTDVDGYCTYTNPRCQAICGFTLEESLGEGWARYIHPDDLDPVRDEWYACVREGREYLREYRCQSPEGIIRWVHVRTSPMLSDRNVLIGYVGTIECIDERKRAEEALRRERDFAEGLITTAQALVLVLDPEGRVVRFNPYMEQLLGYHLDEVRGQDWPATFVPEHDRPLARDALIRTLSGDEAGHGIHAISTRYGSRREIDWSCKALKECDGTLVGVLIIGHDITELKEAQRRALQAERLAAIGEMVTGLAHESGNALHRGQVCLEMLAMEVEDRPEALRLIGRLQQAQNDLHALYEDVRNYSAPIHLDRRDCDLAETWRAAWAHLEHLREGRAATLREEGQRLDLRCVADPFRLEQVFRNILENALAACPDPVAIAIRCTTAEIDGHPALRVAVRDRGPGLGPEQRRRLFEPFFTTKTKGTGLGMAIARRIVEAHGGRIEVGEDGGPGAEIILTLPRGQS